MQAPSTEQVRAALSGLGSRETKIVAGVFAKLVHEPTRARDREWVAQQLTEVTVLAGGFPADSPDQAIEAVRAYLEEHSEELLRSTFLLFQRVGMDLRERAPDGFCFEDAMHQALGYLPAAPGA